MTNRRWMKGEDDPGPGPLETDVALELEALGFTPLTPPGQLRTAAQRALLLAETYDHCQNAAALPALDRQIGNVMAEARQAVDKAAGGLADEDSEEEVDDFTRRRKQRGGGQPDPPAVGGPGN